MRGLHGKYFTTVVASIDSTCSNCAACKFSALTGRTSSATCSNQRELAGGAVAAVSGARLRFRLRELADSAAAACSGARHPCQRRELACAAGGSGAGAFRCRIPGGVVGARSTSSRGFVRVQGARGARVSVGPRGPSSAWCTCAARC